ncbi:MAG: iron-sulfur cluster insertion protein ErpA [Dehalococcoidia bacterium]
MEATESKAPTVFISEKAAAQIKKLAVKEGQTDHGIRVAVKGGGCSGLTYQLALENQQRDGDKVYEQYGVRLFVDKKSVIYLVGTQLDFSDGLNGKGFVFENPNAKTTCGCGTSFSV